MLWMECHFIIILFSYLNILNNKFHVSIWSWHNMFSFYLSSGDDKFIVASLMSSTFVVAHVSLVHSHFFTNITCHGCLCSLILVVCICIFHKCHMSSTFVFSQFSRVHSYFFYKCHMSSTFVFPHVGCVYLHFITNITRYHPARSGQGRRYLTGIVCSESKLGNLHLFHSFWRWEYFENISWEKLSWENLCQLGKPSWENFEHVLKMSVGKT